MSFLENHGLIPSLQFAEQQRHSTETAVLKIISSILIAANYGELTLLGVLNLSAALLLTSKSYLLDCCWLLEFDHQLCPG
jgi:hypothetical protein